MKTFFTFLLIAIILPFSSQAQKKSKATEVRQLSDFTKVNLEGHADLYLYPYNKSEIRIDSKKSIDWTRYETEVIGETLHIRYKRPKNRGMEPRMHIHLAYKNLEKIKLEGKIVVITEKPLIGESLTVKGEGMIKGFLDVEVEDLEVHMEGMIKMEVQGKAAVADLHLEGMGRIDGTNLKAQKASTSVEGMGKAIVHAEEELNASFEGLGSINYSGNPKKKKVSRDGVVIVRKN